MWSNAFESSTQKIQRLSSILSMSNMISLYTSVGVPCFGTPVLNFSVKIRIMQTLLILTIILNYFDESHS